METLEYAFGATYVRLVDGVVEVFQHGFEGSGRVPLLWFGADLTPRKNDQIKVSLGQRVDLTKPFYSPVNGTGRYVFEIPGGEAR